MLDQINSTYKSIEHLIQGNQMLVAGLGVYGVGLFTYIFKDIPLTILKFIKKETTTTLTINNHDPVFYDFLKWVDDKTVTKLVRNWNFNNGKSYIYYNNKAPEMTVGYGRTYAFWSNKLLIVDRFKIEASQTTESKESLTITVLGRKKDVFSKIFDELKKINIGEDKDKDFTIINVFVENGWQKSCRILKRSLDTVFLPNNTKKEILGHIDAFLANKEWYRLNGVPYRTGILLEGPPGTGKTSIIKALAGHLDKSIHYIDATECGPGYIKAALRTVPENSIFVIEEIDKMFSVKSKHEEGEEDKKQSTGSELLNSIDGIIGSENRILIATTNHLDKLDAALIREGRFDLKIHIGYMTDESFRSYIDKMYPDFKDSYKYSVKNNIAPCLVQKLIFDNKSNVHKVLELVAIEGNEFETKNKVQTNHILSDFISKDMI